MKSDSVISVRGLTVGYSQQVPVVFDIDLTVNAGDVIAVVGPNGCGKSTLLKALAGDLHPTHGAVSIAGSTVTSCSPDAFRRLGVSFAPQTRACFRTLSVEDNLRAAAYQLSSQREAARWVRDIMEQFPELKALRTRSASALSGGEKKLLAFAMTLVPHARVLVLDEPAAGLSAEWQKTLEDRIASAAGGGLAVVFAEQNLYFASRVAGCAFVMRQGRVVDLLSKDAFSSFLRVAQMRVDQEQSQNQEDA